MNTLYCRDNLHILRAHISNEPINLIYLDPLLNSKRNTTCCSKQPKYFEHSWKRSKQEVHELARLLCPPNTHVSKMIASMHSFLKGATAMAEPHKLERNFRGPAGSLPRYVESDIDQ
jgi:hypothetical protein